MIESLYWVEVRSKLPDKPSDSLLISENDESLIEPGLQAGAYIDSVKLEFDLSSSDHLKSVEIDWKSCFEALEQAHRT